MVKAPVEGDKVRLNTLSRSESLVEKRFYLVATKEQTLGRTTDMNRATDLS
jgi:hypothetical protein